MTHVDVGITGAKRQSFEHNNPRDLLVRVIEQKQGASEAALLRAFIDAVRDDDDYLEPIIGYWFANNYRSLVPIRRMSPKKRTVEAKHRATAVETIKQRVVAISLDFIMPSGKALRDCTGKECATAGGWLAKIAKRVKPSEKVGAVLSDTQLKTLLRS